MKPLENSSDSQDILSLLKSVFGYDAFLPLQKDVIEAILSGRDVLVVLPTGGGKSICYQLPALMFDGLTVVVSPLISLMQDQFEQLCQMGIPATVLHSGLTFEQSRHHEQLVREGCVKLLYIAPERFQDEALLALLTQAKVKLFAVDEAHCISDWGHDFRPSYRLLTRVRAKFSKAHWLALTATATTHVQADIRESLEMSDAVTLVGSFDRPNLFLEVSQRTDLVNQVLEKIRKFPNQSGIVYCRTRKGVDTLTKQLVSQGLDALPYHAGLEDHVRTENQYRFIRGEIQIMVATIAFGMGIDKPDVRYVIHADAPANLEAYYQQIGRAGRDGLRADCLLLYTYQDFRLSRSFIDQDSSQNRGATLELLDRMVRWINSSQCRRRTLLTYFGESNAPANCTMCDRCTNETGEDDLTIPAQMFLSCMLRTDQRFGAAHVIDVLCGSKSKKVLDNGHDQLSTFGIGTQFSKSAWRDLAEQFVRLGLARRGDFQHLEITNRGRDVLRRATVYGTLPESKSKASVSANSDRMQVGNPALFERLRTLRRELADEAGLPSFVIFHDRTLMEMATYLPQSLMALSDIHGVGRAKLERYGDRFLEVIQDFCTDDAHDPFTANA